MDWKKNLEEYESKKSWGSAIRFLQGIVEKNPHNAEAYVRMIYLIHNILVEEEYPESEHDHLFNLLKEYFEKSHRRFFNNSEYLFFVGKILHIAEWYFGINDREGLVENSLAYRMQKKAAEKEPNNLLFEWACRLSLSDPLAGYLANQILQYDDDIVAWLKSKGFPGTYIIDCLEQSSQDYTESKQRNPH